ncbi:MAG: energy transducer TonB, partial [Pseudanabaenaceae cyanobacterium]
MAWTGQEDESEARSLRRWWLYGGAISLMLHGWLLRQSWSLRVVPTVSEEPPALELVAIESPAPQPMPSELPPSERVPSKPAVAATADPLPVPVMAAPLPFMETAPPPKPDPIAPEPIPAQSPPMAAAAIQPENPPPAPAAPIFPNLAAVMAPRLPTETPTAPLPAAETEQPLLPNLAALNPHQNRPTATPTEPSAALSPTEAATANTTAATPAPPKRESGEDFAQRLRRMLGPAQPAPQPAPPVATASPRPPGPAVGSTAQCRQCDRPSYPAEARTHNWQGQVRLAVDVAPDGAVTAVRLVQSSGYPVLDEAAIRQAWRWQFTASVNGRQNFRASIDFQMEGSTDQRQQQGRSVPAKSPATPTVLPESPPLTPSISPPALPE